MLPNCNWLPFYRPYSFAVPTFRLLCLYKIILLSNAICQYNVVPMNHKSTQTISLSAINPLTILLFQIPHKTTPQTLYLESAFLANSINLFLPIEYSCLPSSYLTNRLTPLLDISIKSSGESGSLFFAIYFTCLSYYISQ